ncbi:hypothetical protein TWF751_010426 [Orbilia oligospora]|nr:hypothetical protein TWF751_010426 [Orbilia oligospora]
MIHESRNAEQRTYLHLTWSNGNLQLVSGRVDAICTQYSVPYPLQEFHEVRSRLQELICAKQNAGSEKERKKERRKKEADNGAIYTITTLTMWDFSQAAQNSSGANPTGRLNGTWETNTLSVNTVPKLVSIIPCCIVTVQRRRNSRSVSSDSYPHIEVNVRVTHITQLL